MSATPSMVELVRRFDTHLSVIGRADATRRKYRYELLCWWTDWLFPSGREIPDLSPVDLEEYIGGLPARGQKRGDAIRALRAFFGWLTETGVLLTNPLESVRVPRHHRARPPELTDEDLRRLLRAAFRREPRRGWAMLLCYVTAARIGSLVAVRPEHVRLHPPARIDFTIAKAGRPYSLPLNRAGQIAVRHLLATANGTLIGVGAERFRQWVRQAEQDAELEVHVWPHLLRHAAATRVARQTDPETWRRMMNHADLSQYATYVAGDDERLRGALPLS